MSFSRKTLAASFSLANGNFQGGGNSKTVSGLRMSARIVIAGGDDSGTMVLAIFGMSLSDMAALTVLPFAMTAVGQNTVVLMAGEDGNAAQVVFKGTIVFAAADPSAQPEVCFRVQATAAQIDAVKPVSVLSQPGSQDVAALMGQIAQTMGRTLENSGVNLRIQNPYLPGTAKQQASALARAARIQWVIDGDVLAIYPAGQPRNGLSVTISSATGMCGYPTFTASGIMVTTLFQSILKFGCKISVQSTLQQACGDWYVVYAEYSLDCQMPNGKWFATLTAGKINVNTD